MVIESLVPLLSVLGTQELKMYHGCWATLATIACVVSTVNYKHPMVAWQPLSVLSLVVLVTRRMCCGYSGTILRVVCFVGAGPDFTNRLKSGFKLKYKTPGPCHK